MDVSPRVPLDVLEHIAAARCEVPPYYRKNDINGAIHLDVPYLPPPREWTAVNLLLASRLTHRAASRFSWSCVRVSRVDDFDKLIDTLEGGHIYLGEGRTMGHYIRTLGLGCTGTEDWSVPQLFGFNGENVPNLDILHIDDALWPLDVVQTIMRLQEDFAPFPSPSIFPSSLDTLLLTSTKRPVSIADLTVLSITAPNISRLQVASFNWNANTPTEAQVSRPSYRFRQLEWLALGASVVAGPDEPPPTLSTLSKLLSVLSTGSGLPCLKRLDILSPLDIPRDFTDLHADTLEIVAMTSTKRPPMHLTPALRRFLRLRHVVLIMGDAYNSFPLGHPTVTEITLSRPPFPPDGPLPSIRRHTSQGSQRHVMQALRDIVKLLPYYPSLETVTVTVEEGFLPWLGSVERRFRERSIVIRTVVL
ncbi:hypothetical protein DFP72DRAFT_1064623 [Ephemerocybe angulata]|uniref:Uncharacterized protein n=1 Tax=Ephemerocybe angulata TaxID=980116 RepID=A0A8H6MA46_9AGAR|nr:hypothetical protein DFP72DRAFT_1064623 [Tulosesus angulatus]